MLHRRSSAKHGARQGVITFLVAVCLVVIVGVVALAIDGGRMYSDRRSAQAAADAAALAAAIDLYDFRVEEQYGSANSAARAAALAISRDNGYDADSDDCEVEVAIPPTSGAYAGRAGYVEVTIHSKLSRGFGSIYGKEALAIRARSVAAGTLEPTKGSVLVLDPKGKKSLHLSKNGTLLEATGDVIVNSKNKKAAEIGKSSQIIAENVLFTSQLDKKTYKMVEERTRGQVHQNVDATPDPFADLPAPAAGVKRTLDTSKVTMDGKSVYVLQPGTYSESLKFEKTDVVLMQPGVYTLEKGMDVKKGAVLEGHGVTLYATDKPQLKFESSSVSLSPPTSGPYANVTMFLDPAKKGKVTFKKDVNLDMSGIIYAPNGEVRFQDTDVDFGDEEEDEEDEEGLDEEEDFESDASPETLSRIDASIIARKLKIDKRSHVVVRGQDIDARRPILRVVE